VRPSSVALFVGALLLFPLIMTHRITCISPSHLDLCLDRDRPEYRDRIRGQLSLGHAAFFAIGAIPSALLSMKMGCPFRWLLSGRQSSPPGLARFWNSIPEIERSLPGPGYCRFFRDHPDHHKQLGELTQGSRGIPRFPERLFSG